MSKLPPYLLSLLLTGAGFAVGVRLSRQDVESLLPPEGPPPGRTVAAPKVEATGPWQAWRLAKYPATRAATAAIDPALPERVTIEVQHEPAEIPYPVEYSRRLRELRAGDWLWLRVRARATPPRTVAIGLLRNLITRDALSQRVDLGLDASWRVFDVLWRIQSAEAAANCCLQFDSASGVCVFEDLRLMNLGWLRQELPLPPLAPGQALRFARPAPAEIR